MGVRMPMVSPGEAHYVGLTTAPPATPKAKDAAAASTASAFSTGETDARQESRASLKSGWKTLP